MKHVYSNSITNPNTTETAQAVEQPTPDTDWDSPHAPGSMTERARTSRQQREECSRHQIAYDATGAIIYGNTPPPKKPEEDDEQKQLFPIITRGDQVQNKPIEFLWEDRFSYQFGLLAGRQGLGKSMFVCYLAAMITNPDVHQWEDGSPCPTGCVMFFTPEGGSSATVQRVRNMGGDIKNFAIYSGLGNGSKRPDGTMDIDLDPVVSDTANLTKAIDAAEKSTGQKVCLIVIDPLADFMGDIRDNNNAEVTRTLRGLDYLAVERKICILGVKHLTKDNHEKAAIYNVGGSSAFTSKPRFVYILDEAPESREATLESGETEETRRVVVPAKCNDFFIRHSLEFSLQERDGKLIVKITALGGNWNAESLQYKLNQINGATSKRRGRPVNEERLAEMTCMLLQGMTPLEVAKKMGASSKTVYKVQNEIIDKTAESFTEFAAYTDGGEAA